MKRLGQIICILFTCFSLGACSSSSSDSSLAGLAQEEGVLEKMDLSGRWQGTSSYWNIGNSVVNCSWATIDIQQNESLLDFVKFWINFDGPYVSWDPTNLSISGNQVLYKSAVVGTFTGKKLHAEYHDPLIGGSGDLTILDIELKDNGTLEYKITDYNIINKMNFSWRSFTVHRTGPYTTQLPF